MSNQSTFTSATRGAGGEAVSRSELKSLQSQRMKPLPSLELTPRGFGMQNSRQSEDLRSASRASYIESRLGRNEGKVAKEFSKAKAHGKAERDFGRSR